MLGIETIRITPGILLQLCAIDEFKGLWNGLDKHSTGLNLLGDVAGFGANFRRVLGPLREQDITPEMIRVLHGAQTAADSGKQGASPWRQSAEKLSIGNGDEVAGVLGTAAPEDIETLMKKLAAWLNASLHKREWHPLVIIAVFTAVFLQINPFEKDSMKTARMLAGLLMLKEGYNYAPYMPLDKIMNARARAVFEALRRNQESLEDGKPDWSAWLFCFFAMLQEQKDTLHERLTAKAKDLSHLPTLSARVMKLFEEHQRLQMKQIIRLANARRSTVKLRLGELVEGGYLKRHGAARSTWYSLV